MDVRVDPSASKNLTIRYASENGHMDVVKLLIAESRIDPSAVKNEAIRDTSKRGHSEIV